MMYLFLYLFVQCTPPIHVNKKLIFFTTGIKLSYSLTKRLVENVKTVLKL